MRRKIPGLLLITILKNHLLAFNEVVHVHVCHRWPLPSLPSRPILNKSCSTYWPRWPLM